MELGMQIIIAGLIWYSIVPCNPLKVYLLDFLCQWRFLSSKILLSPLMSDLKRIRGFLILFIIICAIFRQGHSVKQFVEVVDFWIDILITSASIYSCWWRSNKKAPNFFWTDQPTDSLFRFQNDMKQRYLWLPP